MEIKDLFLPKKKFQIVETRDGNQGFFFNKTCSHVYIKVICRNMFSTGDGLYFLLVVNFVLVADLVEHCHIPKQIMEIKV